MPRIQLVRPHPAQQQILDEASRFNVVALGRRAGKSTLAQHLLTDIALHAKPAGYFAPTYKLLAEFWREVRAVLEPVTRMKSEQDHRLELITGGTLECWSLDDPNPARGRKYGLIVVDEAAMVRDLLEIWQLALRPTLTDLAGGAWFMSTPRGLNDFWSLYQQGQDPLQVDWSSWQMPTSVNPFISTDELVSAQHELPERAWAQEYRAEFLQLEGGGVFRGVSAVSRLTPQPRQAVINTASALTGGGPMTSRPSRSWTQHSGIRLPWIVSVRLITSCRPSAYTLGPKSTDRHLSWLRRTASARRLSNVCRAVMPASSAPRALLYPCGRGMRRMPVRPPSCSLSGWRSNVES